MCSPQTLWIAEDKSATPRFLYFHAHSASAVIEHLKSVGRSSSWFVPVEMIADLVERLEQVRDGKEENENYALDVKGVEMSKEDYIAWSNATPEKIGRASCRERVCTFV